MLRNFACTALRLAKFEPPASRYRANVSHSTRITTTSLLDDKVTFRLHHHHLIRPSLASAPYTLLATFNNPFAIPFNQQSQTIQPKRAFHAAGSKKHYLDFRYRKPTTIYRLNMLLLRKRKMKKHQRTKWRKKFRCVLEKMRLKREIAKEKAFRVELLSMIREAENFDPKVYAMRKIAEANNKTVELSPEERLKQLKDLIREHRYEVDYIKPTHRRADD